MNRPLSFFIPRINFFSSHLKFPQPQSTILYLMNTPRIKGLFITGTDTEIGKTFITSLLTIGLRSRKVNVCPVKPIGAGGVLIDDKIVSEDALIYQRLTHVDEPVSKLNPLCLKRPASPHYAAELESRPISIHKTITAVEELGHKYEYVIVEGIGGWLVPIRYDYSVADFAKDLDLPVVIVSANRLGTLNHTLLTIESIRVHGLEPAGVIVTNPSQGAETDLRENNITTMEWIGNVKILGNVPYIQKI